MTETGIRVPVELRDKIKIAASVNKMTMVAYLDSIVPEYRVSKIDFPKTPEAPKDVAFGISGKPEY